MSIDIPKDYIAIIGHDHAVSGRDEAIAFVGYMKNDGPLIEHEVRAWHNTLIHEQVAELALCYPTGIFWIDGTSEGGKEALGYYQRAGLDHHGLDFGKAKSTIMITLKNSLQQKLFLFADEKTRMQLINYPYELSPTKHIKYGDKDIPDDRVDAAALANYGAFMRRGYGSGENAVMFSGGPGEDDSWIVKL